MEITKREMTRSSGLGHGPGMIVPRNFSKSRAGRNDNEKELQKNQKGYENRFAHLLSEEVGDTQ